MTKEEFYKLNGVYRLAVHRVYKHLLEIYEEALFVSERGEAEDLPRHARCLQGLIESLDIFSRQAHHVHYELLASRPLLTSALPVSKGQEIDEKFAALPQNECNATTLHIDPAQLEFLPAML
jgi:hypothetical protein